MKNFMPLVSVVVPVYNVDEYLKKCLDSIVSQTYCNLEIVLIDDGSKDESGKICDEYALKDSRVVVVHKENQGLSQARNDGMQMATGDYIMFVDSDDWLDVEICAVLIDSLSKYNVEAAVCSYVREYSDRSLSKEILPSDKIFDGKQFQRRLFGLIDEELNHPENLDSFNSMCAKLYPRKALSEICVVDGSIIGPAEDLLFNLEAFSNIQSVIYINRALYHYRKNVTTSITSTYKPNLERQWENLYNRMFSIIEMQGVDDKCVLALNNRIALNVLGIGLNSVCDDVGFGVKYKRIKAIISNERRIDALKQLALTYMPMHWKIFYFSARKRYALLVYILLMIIERARGKV